MPSPSSRLDKVLPLVVLIGAPSCLALGDFQDLELGDAASTTSASTGLATSSTGDATSTAGDGGAGGQGGDGGMGSVSSVDVSSTGLSATSTGGGEGGGGPAPLSLDSPAARFAIRAGAPCQVEITDLLSWNGTMLIGGVTLSPDGDACATAFGDSLDADLDLPAKTVAISWLATIPSNNPEEMTTELLGSATQGAPFGERLAPVRLARSGGDRFIVSWDAGSAAAGGARTAMVERRDDDGLVERFPITGSEAVLVTDVFAKGEEVWAVGQIEGELSSPEGTACNAFGGQARVPTGFALIATPGACSVSMYGAARIWSGVGAETNGGTSTLGAAGAPAFPGPSGCPNVGPTRLLLIDNDMSGICAGTVVIGEPSGSPFDVLLAGVPNQHAIAMNGNGAGARRFAMRSDEQDASDIPWAVVGGNAVLSGAFMYGASAGAIGWAEGNFGFGGISVTVPDDEDHVPFVALDAGSLLAVLHNNPGREHFTAIETEGSNVYIAGSFDREIGAWSLLAPDVRDAFVAYFPGLLIP